MIRASKIRRRVGSCFLLGPLLFFGIHIENQHAQVPLFLFDPIMMRCVCTGSKETDPVFFRGHFYFFGAASKTNTHWCRFFFKTTAFCWMRAEIQSCKTGAQPAKIRTGFKNSPSCCAKRDDGCLRRAFGAATEQLLRRRVVLRRRCDGSPSH